MARPAPAIASATSPIAPTSRSCPTKRSAKLHGLDLFVVDCLRYEPHPTHAHFDQAVAWAEQLKPKHTVLTHMNHMVDYDVIKAKCPPGVEPAYDGLEVEVPDVG